MTKTHCVEVLGDPLLCDNRDVVIKVNAWSIPKSNKEQATKFNVSYLLFGMYYQSHHLSHTCFEIRFL